MSGITLLYIPSDEIVRYVTAHPIDWHKPEMANRGGPGDKAGITPTPAVEEFLRLLMDRRALFTQSEYMHHCWVQWRSWIEPKPMDQKVGVKAKLYRNFYPAMIDSLHVWAMLVETGMFDTCVLNSAEDAISKTDLIVTSGPKAYRLALIGPTINAIQDRQYKLANRGNGEDTSIEIVLPSEYPRQPGNKRWYRKSDVMRAILGITETMAVAAD